MEKKQIELMLNIAEEKKKEIDELISLLKNELSQVANGQIKSRKKRNSGRNGPTGIALKIKKCLENATNTLTPIEIHDDIFANQGEDLILASIRNTLRRFKNDLFESTERGQWKILGKKFNAIHDQPPPIEISNVEDDDLPF